MPDLAALYERRKLAQIIEQTTRLHRAQDNFGGGWDCVACHIRWDWTDQKSAKSHAAMMTADLLLERMNAGSES